MPSIREVAPYIASGALVFGVAGCGGSHNSDPATTSAAKAANVDPMINADCAQTPLDLSQYEATNGDSILQPLNAKLVDGSWEFASNDPAETSRDVAQKIGRNSASLAIAYTIIEAAKTNIVPADAVTEAANTLEQIQSNTAQRDQVCKIVVSGILKAPEQFNYQSSTGKVLTFKPVYDGSKTLSGINGDITSNTGPIPVFNIAPVAGSQNEALQAAIAHEWGITPRGDIVETSNDNGNAQVSHTGKKVQTTVHGKFQALTTHNQTPSNQSNQQNEATGGGTTGTSNGTSNGKAESPHRGKTPERNAGTAPGANRGSGGPHGVTPGPNNSPSGGGGGGRTPGGGGETGTTPGTTPETPPTTPTGTTPETTPTTPTTPTVPTTPTTPTVPTTPTTPTKGPEPGCTPSPYTPCT